MRNLKKFRKKGLGRFLLRGFKKKKKVRRGHSEPRFKKKAIKKGLTEPQPKVAARLSLSLLNPNALRKRKAEVPQEIRLPIDPPVGPPVSTPVSTEDKNLTLVPAPAPSVVTPENNPQTSLQPLLQQSQQLSVQEFLKPGDRLRQSIEAFLLDQRSPHTRRAYGKDLKRFVKFLHAKNFSDKVENLNRTTIIAYKESILSEGLEHTTVDRHLATLRSFFNWLVDDGILHKSPAEGVRFLNPKRLSPTKGFSDEEVKKILSIPNLHTRTGSLHYAILMVLFYCGLRRSELCDLRTVNLGVERNQRILRLRGKGNAERLIVLVPSVWNALRHYYLIAARDMSVDAPLFVPLKNNRTGVTRKPLDPSMIFYIVTRYAKLAGITHRVSPHSCRATAISNARDHHVPDRAIQEFAGWASTDMITRYDKRKTSVENSAARSISYGAQERVADISPQTPVKPSASSRPYTGTTEEGPEQPTELK